MPDQPDKHMIAQHGMRAVVSHGTHPVVLETDVISIWVLLATIQLANRHPAAATSPTIQKAVEVARGFQEALLALPFGQAIYDLIELGWHTQFDE